MVTLPVAGLAAGADWVAGPPQAARMAGAAEARGRALLVARIGVFTPALILFLLEGFVHLGFVFGDGLAGGLLARLHVLVRLPVRGVHVRERLRVLGGPHLVGDLQIDGRA